MPEFDELRALIAEDCMADALDKLAAIEGLKGDRANEVTALRGRVRRLERDARNGLLSNDEIQRGWAVIGNSLLSLLNDLERHANAAKKARVGPTVFLSYTRSDAAVANRLREYLQVAGLAVLIDVKDLRPSESFASFAQRAVHEADATIVIVSEASLASGWVVLEVATAMESEVSRPNRRLIAGYRDKRFMDPMFRIQLTEEIDRRLTANDLLVADYIKRGLDLTDASSDRNQLLKTKSSLGPVLDRFRMSLTVDLSDDVFDSSAAQIASEVRRMQATTS